METIVDLLRHGEAAGGRKLRGRGTDDPLTLRGRADMERMAAHAGPWDVVASSPMQRCIAFAEPLARQAGARLIVEERFSEYDFGEWGGQMLDELWARHGDALAAFFSDPGRVTPPGGERAAAFRERVRSGWNALLHTAPGERVLLVAHGGVLRQLVADALGVPFALHAALEWPHAAHSRLRVFADAAHHDGRSASLVFHARTYPDG